MDERGEPALYARDRVFTAEHAPIYANRVALDGDFERHSHDFIEVVVIGGGLGVHDTIHGRRPIGVGDTFILRPGAWHAYRDCDRLDVYNCCFGLELLGRELAWTRDDPLLNYLFFAGPLAADRRGILAAHLPDEALAACRSHLDELHHLGRVGGPENKAGLIGHLLLVFAHLARTVDLSPLMKGLRRAPVHMAVVRSMRLLEDDLAHAWALTDLAARLHVDGSYLVRLFKAHTGLSPMAYLAHQRAERAATLLLQTALPVAEIGRAVGWPDPNHFARRFKAYFGVSATVYRARYIGGDARADHTHRSTRMPGEWG